MTPTDLRNLLAKLLSGAVGHDEAHWVEQIGEVQALPIYNKRAKQLAGIANRHG